MKELQDIFADSTGSVEVELSHYESFLDLNDEAVDSLIFALTRALGKEVIRYFAPSRRMPVEKRFFYAVEEDLFAVAVGIARFNVFGQLQYFRHVGSPPDGWTNFLIEKRIKDAAHTIKRAVRAFVKETMGDDFKSIS